MDHSKEPAPQGSAYSNTLFLPKTDFPMRAGLPAKEPQILARWAEIDLYGRLRAAGQRREKFVLHDGPPYANGNIHIGHALNKILKDLVTRSQQMSGKDSNYVPGWDCHGLPIEWKIEEEYRAKCRNKDDVPIVEFRRQCREFAARWVDVQREEFKRLGVTGDWAHPYETMAYPAEAAIAGEILKFAESGLLFRGSKPVMWSVVEKTALAEAEVEYEDHVSDTIFVAFPLETPLVQSEARYEASLKEGSLHPISVDEGRRALETERKKWAPFVGARLVIWTTTPWTIPANRAVAYSAQIAYGLYEVRGAPDGNWAKVGDRYLLADKLAESVFKAAKVSDYHRLCDATNNVLWRLKARHPLVSLGYSFDVPLLAGAHVTDDANTGFVHTASWHGREDFDIWVAAGRGLQQAGIDTRIPHTVDGDGFLTAEAPGFEGRRVIDNKGNKGDANGAIIKALVDSGNLVARGRLKHPYPHSWRSKKPLIYRNTPQWFIAMDQPLLRGLDLRTIAFGEIPRARWVPEAGETRIAKMIANRPDWVVSRQRAWGVPIAVFADENGNILLDPAVNERILEAFAEEGADAWFADGARERFLGERAGEPWDKVAVLSRPAEGRRCARSWRYSPDVGSDPEYPDVTPRDAAALRELKVVRVPA